MKIVDEFIQILSIYYTGGEISDGERDLPVSNSPAPVGYAAQPGTPPLGSTDPTADTLVSSTETLLRNIQGLLKVAADNARQQERQISYEKGKLTDQVHHKITMITIFLPCLLGHDHLQRQSYS